jgi:hypothetical protein
MMVEESIPKRKREGHRKIVEVERLIGWRGRQVVPSVGR